MLCCLAHFPSVASLELQQYYGHAQNWFWRVLAHCLVIENSDAPYALRVAEVREHGLAIWDLYAHVRRHGSGDDSIRAAELNAVGKLLAERGPFPILLNGRRTREWRRHYGDLKARVIELPSTRPSPPALEHSSIPCRGTSGMVRGITLCGYRVPLTSG